MTAGCYRPRLILSGLALCAAASGSVARAQTVRGRVVDNAETPLAGVLVIATTADARDTKN